MAKFLAAILVAVSFFLVLPADAPSPLRPAPAVAGAPGLFDAPVVDLAGDLEPNELIQLYCVRCHSDRRMTGNLTLESFDADAAVEQPRVAEKVIRKLAAGMMPPPGARRPDDASLLELRLHLEQSLDRAAAERPNPGRRSFQRLNRAEYRAAIRELFGIEVDVNAFLPPETMSSNFDNIADVQQLSATLMEGYLRAAGHVARLVVGDPAADASSVTWRVPRTAAQLERVPGAPFGTRGGVSREHVFPADGDYVFQVELHPSPTGFLFGRTSLGERLEVSVDGVPVETFEIDRWMTESDPDGMRMETGPVPLTAGPHRVTAAFIRTEEGPVDDLLTPVDHTLADTQIGEAYGVTTVPHLRNLTVVGPHGTRGVSPNPVRDRVVRCSGEGTTDGAPGDGTAAPEVARGTRPDPRSLPVEQARRCAEDVLSRIAVRAYRRMLTGDDVRDLLAFYDEGSAEGGFDAGMRLALQALLSSPHFVFRFEEVPDGVQPGEAYRIADEDLASRLAFFLWSSPPDAELVSLAGEGRLSDPTILDAQVGRMLADPRAEALGTRFAHQWLRLQDLEKLHPDAQLYPYYDETLARAMTRETELFFYHLVREDGSLLELLTADHTWVNERLARHYGIPGVTGPEFRQVHYADDTRRGLLGHGSILAMTSHANRTSPVLRGKWVMEVLLGSPPPPPPPGIPDLEETEDAAQGRLLTVRERLEEHRSNPQCRSCHRVMDPIGLALENYDVTGAWRIKDEGMPVDPLGELYDGSEISGPADLRAALVRRPEPFVRTFTENLMTYALGRRVEYYDMPAIRAISRAAAEEDYALSAFIRGVIRAPAFQMAVLPDDAATDGAAAGLERPAPASPLSPESVPIQER